MLGQTDRKYFERAWLQPRQEAKRFDGALAPEERLIQGSDEETPTHKSRMDGGRFTSTVSDGWRIEQSTSVVACNTVCYAWRGSDSFVHPERRAHARPRDIFRRAVCLQLDTVVRRNDFV